MTSSTPPHLDHERSNRLISESIFGRSSAINYLLSTIDGLRSVVVGRAAVLAITFVGACLRIQNLTYHSLWFDEAISVRWASSSVAQILEVSLNLVEDRLPPLYYLVLKGWSTLAGLSEFSVRYPSVVLGTLLIPIVYLLGKRLFNPAVGLVAALLVSFNPFLVWYSQEARMYVLAVFEGSLGVLCFVIGIQVALADTPHRSPNRLFPWLSLGLAALAGLYTHLYTGFLWPALALWLLLNPQILRRVWLHFGLTMAGVGLLFLPLIRALWRFSGESQPGNPLADPIGRFWGLWRAFMIWEAPLTEAVAFWVLVIGGLFMLIGFVLALTKQAGRLVILLALMPFLIASLLLFRSHLAFFGQRYFIVMTPWLLLLQALAVVSLGRNIPDKKPITAVIRFLPALILIVITALPLPGLWTPATAKEAWRQTLTYLTRHVQPIDAVFIHPEWVRFPYQYYAAQLGTPGQTYAAFFAVDETTDLDGPLDGVVANHAVVWLIESHSEAPDPGRRVEGWFAARYPLVTELYPPGITLKAYAPGYQLEAVPSQATPANILFDEGLRLRGYELIDDHLAATDNLFHPPSNWIHLTLYWSAETGVGDVVPYAHLIDNSGQVWGASLDRSSDAVRLFPPSRWRPEQVIRQDLDVNLNPVAPDGTYQLVVGIGERKELIAPIVLEAEP